jgi:hypothetical protein
VSITRRVLAVVAAVDALFAATPVVAAQAAPSAGPTG